MCVVLYPLHSILVVGQVVETERHPRGSHGWSGDLQQLLHPPMSYKLCCKLLVQEQRGQVLDGGRDCKKYPIRILSPDETRYE